VPPNPTLVAILKEYYKEKNVKSIVDFGCGECTLIAVLKDAGFEVRGVDATPYSKAAYVQQRDLSKEIVL
jgi:2-polyprenyl-3-methyl-5-hydroxy-6-metoxy-1,4-benzoquinol methylase